jgi:hypothetical protein
VAAAVLLTLQSSEHSTARAERALLVLTAACEQGSPLTVPQLARELELKTEVARRTVRRLCRLARAHVTEGLVFPGKRPEACSTCSGPVPYDRRRRGREGEERHCSQRCARVAKNARETDRRVAAKRDRVRLEQGPCAVCGGPMQALHRVRRFCADRCQKTARGRGVLTDSTH